MDKLIKIIDSGEYEKIEGWCTKEKALKMASLINSNDVCLELGVFAGRSLLPICLMTNQIVYGVDAWDKNASLDGENSKINDEWWNKIDYTKFFIYTQNLLNKYNCKNINLIKSTSKDAVKFFIDESIDFLHQDSNHSEKISCNEVDLYYNKVKKNGIWVFDDTNWESTKKAQQLLINYGYKEIYDSGSWKIYKRL
jgi:hypothetical protein